MVVVSNLLLILRLTLFPYDFHLDVSGHVVRLAQIINNGPQYLNGSMDEVRIYNRALSASEIQALSAAGSSPRVLPAPAAGLDPRPQPARSTATPPSSLDLGLIAHWTFDEGSGTTARDSSGRGHTGTLVHGPTWVAGPVGGALNFDGVDDYVEIAHPNDFNFGKADFTIALWVQRTAFGVRGGGDEMVSKCARSSWQSGCKELYFEDDDTVVFNSFDTGFVASKRTLQDTRWHHVAVTFVDSSNTVRLFIDGALDNSGVLALHEDVPGYPDMVSAFRDRFRLIGESGWNDFLNNVLLFLPLGFGLACLAQAGALGRPTQLLMVLIIGSGLSFSIEVLQVFSPSRFPSLSDVLANTLGALLGFLAFHFL